MTPPSDPGSRTVGSPTRWPLTRLSAVAALAVCAAGVLVLILSALVSGGQGAAAAGLGICAVLVPSLLTVGIAVVGERTGADPAPVLLLGYLVKVMAAGLVLFLVPVSEEWPRGWALAGAGAGVVAMLGAEAWQVRRLRIPYFVPRPSCTDHHPTASRRTR